jgi:hypothetical protein
MVVLKQSLLVKFLVVLFLVADVLANRAFVNAHGRYEVPTCPKVIGCRIRTLRSPFSMSFERFTRWRPPFIYEAIKFCQSPGKAGGFLG